MVTARSRRRLEAAALVCAVLCAKHGAQAAPSPTAIDRFAPADAGAVWLGLDDLNFQGDGRFAVALMADWANRPLTVTGAGKTVTVVDDQVFMQVQAALVLRDRLRLALSLPVAIVETGAGATLGGTEYPAPSPGLGDLRLGFDVRLFGDAYFPATAALGMRMWAPLPGSGNDYGREHRPRFSPQASVAGQLLGGYLAYAARFALLYRPYHDVEAFVPRDDEVQFAVGVAGRLNSFLNLGVESYVSTALDGDAFLAKRTTPLEFLFGVNHEECCGLTAAVGAGFGVGNAPGTPDFRLVARVGYVQPDTR